MGVVLTYTKSDGSQETVQFDDAIQEIHLAGKDIVKIDLVPLISCSNLYYLDLSDNRIQDIDLAPLGSLTNLYILALGENQLSNVNLSPIGSCSDFDTLTLSENQIQFVDLSPLESCTDFRYLYLENNQLQDIDLSPLNSCTKLEILNLRKNQLRNIDLTPLNKCTNLTELHLNENNIQSVDVTPLSPCLELEQISIEIPRETILDKTMFNGRWIREHLSVYPDWIKFNAPVKMPSLDAVKYALSLVTESLGWKTLHLFYQTLSVLDLDWMGFVDIGDKIETYLMTLLDNHSKDSCRQKALELLVPHIVGSLEERKRINRFDLKRAMKELNGIIQGDNYYENPVQVEVSNVLEEYISHLEQYEAKEQKHYY